MARMLNLRDILELVDNRFNNRSFAEQKLVREMHQSIFHVFAKTCDELQSLFKQELSEGSRNVTAIPKELTPQFCDHLGHRSTIIDIAWRQTTG